MACFGCGGGSGVSSSFSQQTDSKYNENQFILVHASVVKADLKELFAAIGHSNADAVAINDKLYNPGEITFKTTMLKSHLGLFIGELIFKKESSDKMISFEQLFSLVQEEN